MALCIEERLPGLPGMSHSQEIHAFVTVVDEIMAAWGLESVGQRPGEVSAVWDRDSSFSPQVGGCVGELAIYWYCTDAS